MRSPEQIAALRAEVESIQEWYHLVDLGDGILTPGSFDLRSVLDLYEFPASLAGQRVLDVGCASGFFSVEFARRGAAEVIGLDLPRWIDGDWPAAYRRLYFATKTRDDQEFIDSHVLRAAFELVARELGRGRVRKVAAPVYEVDPALCGTFDLIFSGSMLMHVRDPVLALQRLRSVCRPEGLLIASCSALEGVDGPFARFAGEPHACNYWQMSGACLESMLRVADFEPVLPARLMPMSGFGGRFHDPHFICHARPAGES